MRNVIWKGKKPASLNRRIIFFIVLCWAVPIMLFFVFTTVSYQEGIINKSEAVMEDQLSTVASFASIRIGDAITMCQRPSYERTWESLWNNYRKGEIDENAYLREIGNSLKGKFYLDERFNLYAFYQKDAREPDSYSSRIGASYHNYMEDINDTVLEIMEEGSNYTNVKIINGRIFIIRNLYTTADYLPFGTLVVELNKHQVFKDISPKLRETLVVCIDNTDSSLTFSDIYEEGKEAELKDVLLKEYDGISNGTVRKEESNVYNGYLYQKKFDDYHMGILALAERREIYSSLYDLYEIVLLMLLMFIPVIIYCIIFLRKQIQAPIRRLIDASREMEKGNIGVTVSGGSMPNAEFDYLRTSFDSMSAQVKSLFDSFYTEKLARKDAQISALQAQINPHFLNNTLEMMNWQARMNQDVVVSKMIESLGTVLDYRMNRADVKEIPLWEELRCTDAYFYIMSMRFGQRLQVEKEIDEELSQMLVPPLILQPLVENAIVHGVETVKAGTIKVHIYHDEVHVYVEVQNTGKTLTEEDMERIRGILNGDEDKIPKGQGKHTSIGIRNVNSRIKLVYGEEYGLSIHQEEGNLTVSTIVLPFSGTNMARINK